MFASKTPRDLNHDPEPMISPLSGVRFRAADELLGYEYRPRPEFDHVQHNEPNPALIELRASLSEIGAASVRTMIGIRLKSLEWAMDEHENGWQRFTPETVTHIDHARRVLSRLARIAEVVS